MDQIVRLVVDDFEVKCDSTQEAFRSARQDSDQWGLYRVLQVGERLCEVIKESLQLEIDSQPTLTDDDVVRRCHAYSGLLVYLHETMLGFVGSDPHTSYPDELVPFIQDHLDEQSDDCALIMLPSEKADIQITKISGLYDQYIVTLAPYVASDKRSLAGSPANIIVLQYPSSEARNCFIHSALLGHELMHFTDWQQSITSGLIQNGKIPVPRKKLREQIRKSQNSSAAVVSQTLETLTRWTMEIVADLLATHQLGPAAFFSFARVAMEIGPITKPSASHPDPLLRLTLMLDELRYLGYFSPGSLGSTDLVQETAELRRDLRDWRRYLKRSPTPGTEIQDLIRYTIWRYRRGIQMEVRARFGGQSYDLHHYASEVPKLRDTLAFGSPPAEVLDATSKKINRAGVAGILNAAFDVWYHRRPQFASELPRSSRTESHPTVFEIMNILSRLTLKALESRSFYLASG